MLHLTLYLHGPRCKFTSRHPIDYQTETELYKYKRSGQHTAHGIPD